LDGPPVSLLRLTTHFLSILVSLPDDPEMFGSGIDLEDFYLIADAFMERFRGQGDRGLDVGWAQDEGEQGV
jgi:hypothetical protein